MDEMSVTANAAKPFVPAAQGPLADAFSASVRKTFSTCVVTPCLKFLLRTVRDRCLLLMSDKGFSGKGTGRWNI
jgi:hypothetical protein